MRAMENKVIADKGYILFVINDILQEELEVDLKYLKYGKLADEFLISEYNVPTKGLYECIEDFLNNKKSEVRTMKEWNVAVEWSVCSQIEIKAETLEEAIKIAEETSKEIKLPKNGDYIDGSFTINEEIDAHRYINEE